MAAQYHSLFTTQGLALLLEAIQTGAKLGITHMAYGDGNGIVPTPNANFTKLVKEVYRAPLNRLAPSKDNQNWLEADGVIPSAVGGFNIREVGLYAGDILVAYANYPATYKPSADQGTAQIKTIRIILQIDNTANFELKIDASVVMATIQAVEDAKKEIYESAVSQVETILDLAYLDAWDGRKVNVSGYHKPKNFAVLKPYKGGGEFIYVASQAHVNDGVLCFNGWVRNTDKVRVADGGVVGDGETDDSDDFEKTVLFTTSNHMPLYFEDDLVRINRTINVDGELTGMRSIRWIGNFSTNGVNAGYTPDRKSVGSCIITNNVSVLKLTLTKFFNENLVIKGLAIVDEAKDTAVKSSANAIVVEKGGRNAEFRYSTGYIFEDVAIVGFADPIVFRGLYRADEGGVYNNNYFGQISFVRYYPYMCNTALVLENCTLNNVSFYDSLFFSLSSGAIVKRKNPNIPAEANLPMHFMGQFNRCHFEDCRGLFRFSDSPANNERNSVTLQDVTREFCGLYSASKGNPFGYISNTDIHIHGRYSVYGEDDDVVLNENCTITSGNRLNIKLIDSTSLSIDKINTPDYVGELDAVFKKALVCSDGEGSRFNIKTEICIDDGKCGVKTVHSYGVVGGNIFHEVTGNLDHDITLSLTHGGFNMMEINITNESGLSLPIKLKTISNPNAVQCFFL